MKGYYDIYLRPMGTPFSTIPLSNNLLAGWDKLELPDEVSKLTLEGIGKQLGDGTTLWDAEKLEFECGTLKVDKDEWDYLRAIFNNAKSDILLLDPLNESFIAAAFGMTLWVSKILESGNSIVMKIKGRRECSVGAPSNVLVSETAGSCVIRGRIMNAMSVPPNGPVNGAVVTFAAQPNGYMDVTDATGEYLILASAPKSFTIAVIKGGMTFPTELKLDVVPNQMYDFDIIGNPA